MKPRALFGLAWRVALILVTPGVATAVPGTGARIDDVTVAAEADATTVIIHTAGAARYRMVAIDSPGRLVFDFERAVQAWPHASLDVGVGPVRQIRASQFRASVARVVLELSGPAVYRVRDEPGRVSVVVATARPMETPTATRTPAPTEMLPPAETPATPEAPATPEGPATPEAPATPEGPTAAALPGVDASGSASPPASPHAVALADPPLPAVASPAAEVPAAPAAAEAEPAPTESGEPPAAEPPTIVAQTPAAPEKTSEEPAETAGAPAGLAALGLKGTLTYKNFSHFQEVPQDNRLIRNEGIFELEWSRRFSPWSQLRLVGEARGDDDEFADGVHFQIPETTKRRSILNLKEGVLRLHSDIFEVSLGKQIFAWGTADSVNPTDYINPYDFLDIPDRFKLGVWAAALGLKLGPLNHTFVVIPTFTPSRDPLLKSRWAPRAPAGFAGILDDRELPESGAEAIQYATRLKGTFGGWDVSASYYDGFENTPVLRTSTVTVGPFVVPRLTPVYTRLKAFGFDFSTTVGKFEFHGETAFKFVEHRGRDDRMQSIVGLNYNLDTLPVKWLERIELILEYSRETVLARRENSEFSRSIGFLSSAFRNAASGRVRFKFNEDTQLALSGTVDFESDYNYYTQLKLTHKLTDALHVEAGLELIGGPQDSFWGQWRDNDRAFVVLKYFF